MTETLQYVGPVFLVGVSWDTAQAGTDYIRHVVEGIDTSLDVLYVIVLL